MHIAIIFFRFRSMHAINIKKKYVFYFTFNLHENLAVLSYIYAY